MRSSPPVQLAFVVLGFLVLAWPLIQLTSSGPAVAAQKVEQAEPQAATPCLLRVSYAHPPQSLSLKLGKRELLSTTGSGGLTEFQAELPLAKEGLELQVTAQWPAGTPRTALTVELEPDGLDAQSQTRWTDSGDMDELLLFLWPDL
jgi:hypothetical protein